MRCPSLSTGHAHGPDSLSQVNTSIISIFPTSSHANFFFTPSAMIDVFFSLSASWELSACNCTPNVPDPLSARPLS